MTTVADILTDGPPPGGSHRWIARALVQLIYAHPWATDYQLTQIVCGRFPDGQTASRRSEVAASIPNARRWVAAHPARQEPDGAPWRPLPAVAPVAPLPPPSAWATPPRAPLNELLVLTAEGSAPDAWEKLGFGSRAQNLPTNRLDACRAVLDRLYQPRDLVCAGPDLRSFKTQTYAEWNISILESQHIVPSPMAARTGKTKDGRVSCRTLDNAAQKRKWCVVEFDGPSLPRQAARITWLSALLPGRLTLIVFSGNKSLHSWYDCRKLHPQRLRAFYRTAVALGADPQLYLPHQPARLPCGLRMPGGAIQETCWCKEK